MKYLLIVLALCFAKLADASLPLGVTPTAPPYSASGLSGGPFYYEVTGADFGAIFGTDVYTADSAIVKAAVHSGAVAIGETGVIKLTLLGNRSSFPGGTQNGVSSFGYFAPFPAYSIELLPDLDFSITDQPQNILGDLGASVSLSVSVTGTGQSFQWYSGPSGDTSNPVSGGNSATLSITIGSNPVEYWVEVSNASGAAQSDRALVAARVTGSTNDWQDITINLPAALQANNDIGPILATGGELYVLAENGILRSTDNGENFTLLNTVAGSPGYDLSLEALRFVERVGAYIYVGTAPSQPSSSQGYRVMHRMEPGDTTWVRAAQANLPSPITASVEDVSYDASTGTYYAASAFAGCYVSTDGLTWVERRTNLPLTSGSFVNAGSVVAENGKAFLTVFGAGSFKNGGVYTSDDAGLNWEYSGGVGGSSGTLAQIGSRLIYSTAGPITTDDGVYYSDDEGDSWDFTKFLGLSFDIRTNDTALFAARGDPLKFSTTGGLTWDDLDRTNLPSFISALWIEPSDTHLFLYASDEYGTWRLYRRTLASLDLTPTTQFVKDPSTETTSRFVNPGQTLNVRSLAAGPNIAYQWQIDGFDLPGAAGAELNYVVDAGSAGDLTVEVTGDDRTIESDPIALTVIPSDPGYQDVSFRQSDQPMQGTLVLYDDYRILQVEAPRMQLLDTSGNTLVRREQVADSRIRRAFIDSQGRLVGFGEFSLARLDADTLADDPSFTTVTFAGTTEFLSGTIRLYDVVELPGQGYLCAVDTNTTLAGVAVPALVLIDYTGARVTSFPNPFTNASTNFAPSVSQIGVTPGGKILCSVNGARWSNGDLLPPIGLVRLNSDGTRDNSFAGNNDDIPITYRSIRFFTQQSDGKILYSVDNSRYIPKRLNADGSYDASFNANNDEFERTIGGFIPLPSGKVIVYGGFEDYQGDRAIGHARLLSDGSFDDSYNADEGFKSFATQKAIASGVYDDRGFVYYVSPTGELGGFRETEQIGLVRIFAGDSAPSTALQTYLAGFTLPGDQLGEADDPDGDGFENLFELAYQTDPSSASEQVVILAGSGVSGGGTINTILGDNVVDPAKAYYTQDIRLPKNPPAGITLTVLSTQNLPNFGDGSTTVLPLGPPIDEGDTILQTYYQVEDVSVAPRGFIVLEGTQE